MSASLGIKRLGKTIIKYPALILTAIFSYWTFGPVDSLSALTWCYGGNNKLGKAGRTYLDHFF